MSSPDLNQTYFFSCPYSSIFQTKFIRNCILFQNWYREQRYCFLYHFAVCRWELMNFKEWFVFRTKNEIKIAQKFKNNNLNFIILFWKKIKLSKNIVTPRGSNTSPSACHWRLSLIKRIRNAPIELSLRRTLFMSIQFHFSTEISSKL